VESLAAVELRIPPLPFHRPPLYPCATWLVMVPMLPLRMTMSLLVRSTVPTQAPVVPAKLKELTKREFLVPV
jgi:hypothetical protein